MRILRYRDLRDQKGIYYSRQHLDRLIETGAFPKKVPLGTTTICWLEEEIDTWLKVRIAARDSASAPTGT
jgi:prophage regulatory protein